MTKGKILGDIHQIDKDVELCRTTNERIRIRRHSF